jgi:vacuolar-type H+-ATPase subunit F/Vma7
MSAIQIIGDANTVLAFALGGVPGHVVHSAEEACAVVEAVVGAVRVAGGPVHRPKLLLVTSATADRIRGYLDAIALDSSAPLILEFPGFGDPPSENPVQRFVDRVLGVAL